MTILYHGVLAKRAELAAAIEYIKLDIVCGTESWRTGIKPGKSPSEDKVKYFRKTILPIGSFIV